MLISEPPPDVLSSMVDSMPGSVKCTQASIEAGRLLTGSIYVGQLRMCKLFTNVSFIVLGLVL